MTPVTTFSGKTVALFGLGGSGLATALALKAGGAHVVACDDNPAKMAEAEAKGIETADLRTATGRGSPRSFSRPACRSPIPSRIGR